ncbi:MAG TPA: glutamate-1-semialdehyde 2,1-aminomutase [Candidatus Limnocylindrales bacterium]
MSLHTPLGAPIAATGRQALLRQDAEDLFPGGVNSPVRAFRSVGRPPLILTGGSGSRVRDADGNVYLDYIGSWGPAILGHGRQEVVDAVREAALNGFALGATSPLEIELGGRIRDAVPSMARMRFVSSGTEAVMSAIRLARGATGREIVVKFAGGYHGHGDSLLVDAGSGLATLGMPGSAGVTKGSAHDTIVVPYNDPGAIDAAFDAYPGQIACVIAEGVVANVGVVPPDPAYLERLRALTASNGTLLILDEVISGFRVARGGAQERYGITPDITTLGKIIGGGMPVGAYGASRDLMALIAPEGPVYQAGTLSGHPLAMAAGIATLDLLTPDVYEGLERAGARLEAGLREAAAEAGREVAITRVGSLLTVFFRSGAPRSGGEALESDRDAYARFFRSMLDSGVLLPPSQFEAWFIGAAHSDADLDATVTAATKAFRA